MNNQIVKLLYINQTVSNGLLSFWRIEFRFLICVKLVHYFLIYGIESQIVHSGPVWMGQ